MTTDDEIIQDKHVSKKYLEYRMKVLNYTNIDMNLALENDEQVYIGVFDIPIESGIVGFQTQSLALVFGLNTHIYHGSGAVRVNLEDDSEVKRAMQSALISSHQALKSMKLTEDIEFYNSSNVRVYLKTGKGIYFKELNKSDKVDRFLEMLMNHILVKIGQSEQFGQ